MDNQQEQPQEPIWSDQETERLQAQLRETAAAERFFELGTGKLFVELVQRVVNKGMKDILSSKYDKDHAGFLQAKASIAAHQDLLRKMQVAASPQRRSVIVGKLDEITDEQRKSVPESE